MSYCVKCGHELIEKENGIDGMVPYCPNCHEFRFPMFNSAVSALVLNPKKDKILLIQQYGHKDNILIAGYVTKGENAKQALFREVKEETGYDVSHVELLLPASPTSEGLSDECNAVVLAELKDKGTDNKEEFEDIDAALCSRERIKKMLLDDSYLFSNSARLLILYLLERFKNV